MELKEFIKTALRDISDAVSELQTELSNGAVINPEINAEETAHHSIIYQGKHRLMQIIEFNIAVSVSDSEKKGKKGILDLKIVNAEIGDRKNKSSEALNRIAFKIPVCLPLAVNPVANQST